MEKDKNVTLRKPKPHEAEALYELMVSDEKWTEFNAPYFGYSRPTFDEFCNGIFTRLREAKNALAIDFGGRLIGTVTYYWEDERTRWLEAGVLIFDSSLWGEGLGKQAIALWITHILDTLELERVGMTTWSGNPRMIAAAKSIGFKVEGTLRKVRYYDGVYYDSVKLGVLRDEWLEKR